MREELRDPATRFARAARAAGANRPADGVVADLLARYAEPRRHYHTLTHVLDCLSLFDRFEALAERPAEVELALWFHDAVYDPERSDNEAESARLADEALRVLEVPEPCRTRVVRAIEATRHHDATEGDAALLVDLDLAILGADAESFRRFEEQIRSEYAQVPDALFRMGRRQVLAGFLGRPRIYRHTRLAELFEGPARANLARRIEELSRS
ncbi:MAG: N-methyl-D-aspartate receptor NMDAR2C subunit [Deltaproteobacteria bacterium]|nr:N-methyl-D-aspartate receptor NMDAR2C subunit [Deltaproteobacteria bacterium]